MVKFTFTYKQMMDLGFKRFEETDSVWFNMHGYNWFRVEYKLGKGLYIHWDCETGEVELVRWKPKTGDILGRMPIFSEDELKETIEFYRKK